MKTQDNGSIRRIAFTALSLAGLAACSFTAANALPTGQDNQTGTMNGQTNGQTNSDQPMNRRHRRERAAMTTSGTPIPSNVYLPSRYTDLGPAYDDDLMRITSESNDLFYPRQEDPIMIDPAPWNYPAAAPGGIDTHHYTDYTMDHLAQGSLYNLRREKERVWRASVMAERRRLTAQLYGPNSTGMMTGSR
jgi:hypothetical protein